MSSGARPMMMPLSKTRFHLKAVCSNPRHKREKSAQAPQKLRLNELRLAPI